MNRWLLSENENKIDWVATDLIKDLRPFMIQVHLNTSTIPDIATIQYRSAERRVLMVEPTYFDVLYEINPHMSGMIGTVDTTLAYQQWTILKDVYEQIGFEVEVMKGVEGLPDMVFCANQTFPFIDETGRFRVILSKMASPYRVEEVPYFQEWYKTQGYDVIEQTDPPVDFEGMGDAIWHPNRQLLYIGYGFRTKEPALQRAAECIGCDVIGLELVNPHFYHLDTAFCVLDESTAIFVREAFTIEGVNILSQMFEHLIEVPIHEAKEGFVTNGFCPDGHHFVVQKGNPKTKDMLESHGFTVIEVETGEFIKSGGSVFCMKMFLP